MKVSIKNRSMSKSIGCGIVIIGVGIGLGLFITKALIDKKLISYNYLRSIIIAMWILIVIGIACIIKKFNIIESDNYNEFDDISELITGFIAFVISVMIGPDGTIIESDSNFLYLTLITITASNLSVKVLKVLNLRKKN